MSGSNPQLPRQAKGFDVLIIPTPPREEWGKEVNDAYWEAVYGGFVKRNDDFIRRTGMAKERVASYTSRRLKELRATLEIQEEDCINANAERLHTKARIDELERIDTDRVEAAPGEPADEDE